MMRTSPNFWQRLNITNRNAIRFIYGVHAFLWLRILAIYCFYIYLVDLWPPLGIFILIYTVVISWLDGFMTLVMLGAGDTPIGMLLMRISRMYLSAIYIFGLLYFLLDHYGLGALLRSDGKSLSLIDPYYFSAITLATVGYGDVYPGGILTKFVVVIEVIAGTIFNITLFGIAASFMTDRFRIHFSDNKQPVLDPETNEVAPPLNAVVPATDVDHPISSFRGHHTIYSKSYAKPKTKKSQCLSQTFICEMDFG